MVDVVPTWKQIMNSLLQGTSLPARVGAWSITGKAQVPRAGSDWGPAQGVGRLASEGVVLGEETCL